jgi:polar amino acid transport system substrate-binding protein
MCSQLREADMSLTFLAKNPTSQEMGSIMASWQTSRRRFMVGTGAALLAATRRGAVAETAFKTVEPGVLTIANSNEMPMIAMEGGKLIGSDAEILATIAKRMGLGVKSAQMEWSATVQSVKSGRADIMLGNMGWTPARAQALLITDAIYYAGAFVCMKRDKPFTTSFSVNDVKGRSIGTVNGFTIVPEMKKLPGVGEVKLYDNSDGCVRDVVAGRLDFAVLDGPLVDYMILKNPNWNLKQVPLAADPAFPQLTSKQHTVMGMNQENFDLFDAVNAGVKWMWQTRQNAALMQKYGISNPDYLVPPEKNPRIGVDRDAAGNVLGAGAHPTRDFSALFA